MFKDDLIVLEYNYLLQCIIDYLININLGVQSSVN